MGSQGISCSPEQNKAELCEEKENEAAPGRAVCSLKPLGFAGRMSQGQAVLRGRAESRRLLLRRFRQLRRASPAVPKAAGEPRLCTLLWWPRCSQFLLLCFSLSLPLIPQREIPPHKAEHSQHMRAPGFTQAPGQPSGSCTACQEAKQRAFGQAAGSAPDPQGSPAGRTRPRGPAVARVDGAVADS